MSEPRAMAGRIVWRREPRPEDVERVRELVAATGFFSAEEVEVAAELVDDRLTNGVKSDYRFLFAEIDGEMAGYSCFGRIPFTRGSYDLYWIAVSPDHQRLGIGRLLVAATEADVRKEGGERVYVETSTRAQYRPTRAFYEQLGYRLEARLQDFYAPGDGKAIFCRVL
jgi:ribosomal protein S18 acetylase RimI-like enzyme